MTQTSPPPPSRRAIWIEIAIVLGLSLGASAVYSIVSIIAKVTDERPLAEQTAAINASQSVREWLDFSYQFLGNFFDLVPVALALYLLWRAAGNPFTRIGLTFREPSKDVARGFLLLAVIGIPGIGLFFVGRALGITANVVPAADETFWWTVPILIFAALRAALSEEIIVVAYLFERLKDLGWSKWSIISSTAVLRGSYHLYQGFGPFVGNVVMGIVFGWCYERWGRVMPLVIAHWVIDIISFVGYGWAVATFPELFRLPST